MRRLVMLAALAAVIMVVLAGAWRRSCQARAIVADGCTQCCPCSPVPPTPRP